MDKSQAKSDGWCLNFMRGHLALSTGIIFTHPGAKLRNVSITTEKSKSTASLGSSVKRQMSKSLPFQPAPLTVEPNDVYHQEEAVFSAVNFNEWRAKVREEVFFADADQMEDEIRVKVPCVEEEEERAPEIKPNPEAPQTTEKLLHKWIVEEVQQKIQQKYSEDITKKFEGEISGFFSSNEYMYLGGIGKQNPMGY
ncbi:hypothetical protein P5673_004953 [Acropora cervicornis]|uniref:Uncharacterized protein n=1 Tax=Acropora cervicornis TaxID=6130 RepID=A0AAD9VDR7_ACRCE|nr:hypothetical protein P5673_004953 [Acropora cervicornis]